MTIARPPADGPVRRTCPRCGAPHESAQEYCLQCGLRLPAPSPDRGPSRGGWLWPVALTLVVAAIAAVVAIVVGRDDGSSATRTFVGTVPTPTASPTATVRRPAPKTGTTTTRATRTATQPPRPRGTLIGWPSGRNGWTVVLASLPTRSGRARADELAARALAAGLRDVGVLDSGSYSSLHPGYYVIFSGVYLSQANALSAVSDAVSKGYRTAYARRITP